MLSADDGITMKNWFCWTEVRPLGINVSFTEIYTVLFDLEMALWVNLTSFRLTVCRTQS